MIDLQNLKNAIAEGGFSEEAKNLMLGVVDGAIARGSMTAEEKKKIRDIMDVEIDANALEQGAHEEVSEMIEGFLAENDAIAQTASDNLDDLQKEENSTIEEMKSETTSSQSVPQPPVPQPESVVPSAGEVTPQVPVAPETPPWQPPQ